MAPSSQSRPPRHIPSTIYFALVFLPAILSLTVRVEAHQSISFPRPISRDVACRVTAHRRCPGPCPRTQLRLDQTPNNPSITVKRGQTIKINIMANNHRGGFSRWSLVHVRDMYNHKAHQRNAFFFSCSDLNMAKCSKRWRMRDCQFDWLNEFYQHPVRIPEVVDDGVYVMGWVWYGGGLRWGLFGDYYDCMYIRVQGGPRRKTERPIFKTGKSMTMRNGKCRATVNKVGICWREPCPGGGRFTKWMKPWEFSNGRRPGLLKASTFRNPYQIAVKKKTSKSCEVKSMTIRSADVPRRVFTSSRWTKRPHLLLTRSMQPTVTCETKGAVKYVEFYMDGRKGRRDFSKPYSIGGDWKRGVNKRIQTYAPWAFNIARKVVPVTCMAMCRDGMASYETIELSTMF